MQHNRREGSMIVCGCGAGGWAAPGHATAEEAERCFYDYEKSKGVQWRTSTQASRCRICDAWTPDNLEGAGNLINPIEYVCREHFEDTLSIGPFRIAQSAEEWLWERHPFSPGIQIAASW